VACLLPLASERRFTLEQCIYRQSEHKKRVGELLKLAKLEEESKDEPIARPMTFLDEFIKFATTAKDKTFVEENEWRLVNREGPGGIIPNLLPISYREGPAFPIPYQKFKLHDEIAKELVREVVVGPGPHKSLIAKTIEDMSRRSIAKQSSLNLRLHTGIGDYPGGTSFEPIRTNVFEVWHRGVRVTCQKGERR
jgi:hypothetical protein